MAKAKQGERVILCCQCGENITEEDKHLSPDGENYCSECFNEKFVECSHCNGLIENCDENYSEYSDSYYCESCFGMFHHECGDCGETFHNSQLEINFRDGCHYCDDCYPSDDQYLNEHSIPFQTIKSETFKKNKNKEFCGVEIECINEDLNKNQFNYNELLKWGFSQTSDGSLCEETGVEFYSNAFNGDLLFKKITAFCKELNKRGYKINTDCGLHIHIGINKRNTNLKKIYLFYRKFEELFFKMVSESRTYNSACQTINGSCLFNEDDLLKAKNNTEIKKLFYETKSLRDIQDRTKRKYNEKRYCWVNFHSIFLRGTLEIRLHNGTIDSKKIINWFKINLAILNFLKSLNIETIKHLPNTREFFLSIFDDNLRKYIKQRWKKFEKGREEKD